MASQQGTEAERRQYAPSGGLEVLLRVAEHLSAELDVDKVLHLAAREISGVFEAERVFLVEVDPSGRLRFRLARTFEEQDIPQPEHEVSHAVVRQVAHTRRPVLVADATEDPRFAQVSSVRNLQLHSVMAAPLLAQEELLGVAYADNRRFPNVFNQHKLGLMGLLANQVGIALRNADLFRKLTATRADLAQAERFKALGEVAAFVAHEIKNPLTSMRLMLDVLRERWQEDAVRGRVFSTVLEDLGRLQGAAERIVSYARPTRLERQPAQVQEVLDAACDTLRGQVDGAGVTIRRRYRGGMPAVLVDKTQLREVFVNLLKNATEAMANAEERLIELTIHRSDPGAVEVAVEDTGPGIAEAVLPCLFEPFRTGKPGGTGLGLAYCRKVIREHGGDILAENRERGGARFRVRLPVRGM
jgi:signal transduction histidine kinase